MFKSMIAFKNAADKNCRICKKTFCCAKCRDRHVNEVHPGLNGSCFLCASKALPMRPFESEKLDLRNEQLLCHIINKHLPLHCHLCGDTFESGEDFKSFGACKWWSRHCLTSPVGSGYLEKLKLCSMSDSNYNDKFYTPCEVQRKTSTPMFAGQKVDVEYQTPCIPDFSLKTPQTNSSSIVQCSGTAKTQNESRNSEARSTDFFSFSTHVANEDTPFKASEDDQFPRSNSGRKLDIKEEKDETADKAATVSEGRILSPVDMDLTSVEGGIPRDSPQLDPICEEPDETPEIVKVRFSDEHKILPEFEKRMESCVKSILNASMEDDVFHDANDAHESNAKNAEDATAEHPTKITGDTKDEKNAKCDQEKDEACTLEKSLQNYQNNLHVEMIQDNEVKKNEKEKENRNSEPNSVTMNQQGTRVLMMVLVENNSGGLDGDLMPLINSGLKKLQEQMTSANYSTPDTIESSGTNKVRRQSVTKMQMTVSTVESYSVNNTTTAAVATDCQEIVPSTSLSVQNTDERNGGFLSSFSQAVKYVLRSFSGLNDPLNNNNASNVVQQQKNMKKSTSTPELSGGGSSLTNLVANGVQIRSGKRARDVTEAPSKWDSSSLAVEGRSPLAKRHRPWYTMIKGRKPLDRMRNNRATSSRGVSTETQIFSQGSLTVGDTVLPLPTRAHQSPTQTEQRE
ncbi:hypothetical protein DMN91_011407 [Ooceraea biroi]|uniref:C2H2-type domain-containing protein n=1 Tax=Ooceraea biroi TaxID=2015173 RepID=A0A3L8D6I8_OOCBI|nr:uncharacterized protein LOC105284250 [Ooceraea biroi]RLU15653.1 hypothetical protein DMN91_011407 [Ooceraea biroi]